MLASAQDRLPTIPPDHYADQQKQAADFLAARKVPVFGPFEVHLVGINGYCAFLAMALNAARHPLPKDGTPLPRLPE